MNDRHDVVMPVQLNATEVSGVKRLPITEIPQAGIATTQLTLVKYG